MSQGETRYRKFEVTFTLRFDRDNQKAADEKMRQLRDYIQRACEIQSMSTAATDLT